MQVLDMASNRNKQYPSEEDTADTIEKLRDVVIEYQEKYKEMEKCAQNQIAGEFYDFFKKELSDGSDLLLLLDECEKDIGCTRKNEIIEDVLDTLRKMLEKGKFFGDMLTGRLAKKLEAQKFELLKQEIQESLNALEAATAERQNKTLTEGFVLQRHIIETLCDLVEIKNCFGNEKENTEKMTVLQNRAEEIITAVEKFKRNAMLRVFGFPDS